MEQSTYEGRCFCGAVALVATGRPVGMGFCHCASCRSWGAAPVNAFTLWKPDSVKVVRGDVGVYQKSELSQRQFCLGCGGHLMTTHPRAGLVDVYAATLPAFPFAPELHVHYQETVLPLRDGLPKFRDLPKDMGGSGDLLSE